MNILGHSHIQNVITQYVVCIPQCSNLPEILFNIQNLYQKLNNIRIKLHDQTPHVYVRLIFFFFESGKQ